MLMYMRISFLFLLFTTFLFSCKKETTNDTNSSTADIFAVGTHGNQTVLWKNATETTLPAISGAGNYSTCTALFVAGNEVYITGNDYDTMGYLLSARVWKNGAVLTVAPQQYFQSIVVSGSDVYVGGTDENGNAQIWKNGTALGIANGSLGGSVQSICIVGNDVYAGGYSITDTANIGLNTAATIWKNGVRSNLTSAIEYDGCSSIAVDGNGDVYAAGYISNGQDSRGIVWKNGSIISDINNAWFRAVCLLSSTVYAGGSTGFNAITTANGNTLYNQPSASINTIFATGADVYTGGYYYDAGVAKPVIWKNGISSPLTTDQQMGEVVAVFVQ